MINQVKFKNEEWITNVSFWCRNKSVCLQPRCSSCIAARSLRTSRCSPRRPRGQKRILRIEWNHIAKPAPLPRLLGLLQPKSEIRRSANWVPNISRWQGYMIRDKAQQEYGLWITRVIILSVRLSWAFNISELRLNSFENKRPIAISI